MSIPKEDFYQRALRHMEFNHGRPNRGMENVSRQVKGALDAVYEYNQILEKIIYDLADRVRALEGLQR